MEELNQKKHGLPGVPIITGSAGADGTGGNHVYFGFINDFFDIVDVSADYLIRTATGDNNIRYTGAFDDEGNPIETVLGQYLDIMSDSEFPGRYSVSNPSDNTTSREYIKADIEDIGLDAHNRLNPWNYSFEQNQNFRFNSSFYTDDDELWPEFQYNLFDTLIPEDREHRLMLQQIYPYVDFSGLYDGSTNNPNRIKPEKHYLSQSVRGIFDLFSIAENDIEYQFAYTPTTKYYDGSIFDIFSDSSLHNIDNPTIDFIIENKSRQSPVDFIKFGTSVSLNIQIPDKLKEYIKAGDVIYFYTNEEQFKDNYEIEYMTVITNSLERCSYQLLIDNATIVYPYTFKFTSEANVDGDDYLYSTTPAVTGYYNETNLQDIIDVSAYGRNMVNMLNCLGSDTAFQIGTLSSRNEDNSDVIKLTRATDRQITETLNIKAKNTENGELTIMTSSSVLSKPMLKISNAYFRKNNIGNIETCLSLEPSSYVYDENGLIHTIDEEDINVTTGKVTLNPLSYIKPSCKQWQIGVIVLTYTSESSNVSYNIDSQSFTKNDSVFRRYEWNLDSEKLSFSLEKTFGDKTIHNIISWVAVPGSYKKMSRTLTATFDVISGQYVLSTYSNDIDMTENSPVIFDVASISSDMASEIPVKITFPYWQAIDDEQSYKIFINTTQITEENTSTPVKINNWCSVKWKDIELSYDNTTRTITLLFDFKNNLPSIWGEFNTAKDYNASPGSTSTIVDGCDLFNAIISGMKIKTEKRIVNVAINYDYAKINSSTGKVIDKITHTDYTKVVLPGYNDPRQIPDIKISLYNDLRSLEEANKSSLGVMANEFLFFVDIDINGFNKNVWGSFVPEENITIDMKIKNASFDKEFADKYNIPNPKDTRTLHVNTVKPDDDMSYESNNYVRFKTYVMEPKVGSPYGKTQKLLDEYNEQATVANLISAEDSIFVYTETSSEQKYGNQVKMTSEIFNLPDERRYGIQDNITIELKGIHFSDIENGKFRFRVVTEMSNPLFSILFFRFYVSDLTINYKQGELIRSFYVGQKNMKPDMQTYSGDYMFASETIRAFICPITMTAIPEEDKVEPVSPAIMLNGSKQQISMKTGAYVPASVIIENKAITENEKVKKYVGQQQSIGWFNFSLKKKYFQDDVTIMKMSPIRPEIMREIITKDAIINDSKFDEITSTVKDPDYLTVVYNSEPSILSTLKREDVMSFYYNSILYDAYGYSQKNNRKPVSTEQTGVVEVRDSSLEESVTFWNRWYLDNRTTTNDKLFRGIVSAYGNGYVYLNSQDGENLDVVAQKNGVYNIDDTRQKSEDNIQYTSQMGYNATRPAAQPTRFVSAPGSDAWFRTLLYQCQWQYPKHYTDNVTSVRYVNMYDIVTPGEYQKDSRLKIPYNVAYSLYPRCAYDTDNDMAIVFMFRCPSVVKENQYKMTKEDLRVYVENYQPLSNERLFPAD